MTGELQKWKTGKAFNASTAWAEMEDVSVDALIGALSGTSSSVKQLPVQFKSQLCSWGSCTAPAVKRVRCRNVLGHPTSETHWLCDHHATQMVTGCPRGDFVDLDLTDQGSSQKQEDIKQLPVRHKSGVEGQPCTPGHTEVRDRCIPSTGNEGKAPTAAGRDEHQSSDTGSRLSDRPVPPIVDRKKPKQTPTKNKKQAASYGVAYVNEIPNSPALDRAVKDHGLRATPLTTLQKNQINSVLLQLQTSLLPEVFAVLKNTQIAAITWDDGEVSSHSVATSLPEGQFIGIDFRGKHSRSFTEAIVDPSKEGMIRHELGHAIEYGADHRRLVDSGVYRMNYTPSEYSKMNPREKFAEYITLITKPGFEIQSLPTEAQKVARHFVKAKQTAEKSMVDYLTKDRGQPCKQGEAAELTGCIPAKEEPGQNNQPQQQAAGEQQQQPAQPLEEAWTVNDLSVKLPKVDKTQFENRTDYVSKVSQSFEMQAEAAGIDPTAYMDGIQQKAEEVWGRELPKSPMAEPIIEDEEESERESEVDRSLTDLLGFSDDAKLATFLGIWSSGKVVEKKPMKWKVHFPSNPENGAEGVFVEVSHPDVTRCQRFIGTDSEGKKFIHNDVLVLHEGSQRTGIGTDIFSGEVEEAAKRGFDYIGTVAAGAADEGFNGYYTWPRLGYDESLESLDRYNPTLVEKIRAKFPDAESILDVFEAGGSKWWKENGSILYNAKFDLTEDSRSRQVLNSYLAARKAKQATGKSMIGYRIKSDIEGQPCAEHPGATAAQTGCVPASGDKPYTTQEQVSGPKPYITEPAAKLSAPFQATQSDEDIAKECIAAELINSPHMEIGDVLRALELRLKGKLPSVWLTKPPSRIAYELGSAGEEGIEELSPKQLAALLIERGYMKTQQTEEADEDLVRGEYAVSVANLLDYASIDEREKILPYLAKLVAKYNEFPLGSSGASVIGITNAIKVEELSPVEATIWADALEEAAQGKPLAVHYDEMYKKTMVNTESPLTKARLRTWKWTKNYDVFLSGFAGSWAFMHGTEGQRVVQSVAKSVFPQNTDKSFWIPKQIFRTERETPFHEERVAGHLKQLKKNTEAFYKKRFKRKGLGDDLSKIELKIHRGVAGAIQVYTPAAAESWSLSNKTPTVFGRMMRMDAGSPSYTILEAAVTYNDILFSWETMKTVPGWPPDTALKGKKEVVPLGGALKHVTAEIHR